MFAEVDHDLSLFVVGHLHGACVDVFVKSVSSASRTVNLQTCQKSFA